MAGLPLGYWQIGTGGPNTSSLEDVQHELSCPICLDWLDEPVEISDCGHAFCAGCLLQVVTAAGSTTRGRAPCPTCRTPVTEIVPARALGRTVRVLRLQASAKNFRGLANPAEERQREREKRRAENRALRRKLNKEEISNDGGHDDLDNDDGAFTRRDAKGDGADGARGNSAAKQLAVALYHLNEQHLSSHDGLGGAFPSWEYFPRSSCCGCLPLRGVTAAVSMITICANIAIINSVPSGKVPTTNLFSIFTFMVGFAAAISRSGNVAAAFACYAAADTFFALCGPLSDLGTEALLKALSSHHDALPIHAEVGIGGAGQGQVVMQGSGQPLNTAPLVGSGRTAQLVLVLFLNIAFNFPCFYVAWSYWRCFALPQRALRSRLKQD